MAARFHTQIDFYYEKIILVSGHMPTKTGWVGKPGIVSIYDIKLPSVKLTFSFKFTSHGVGETSTFGITNCFANTGGRRSGIVTYPGE
jgi:hypothetical protein